MRCIHCFGLIVEEKLYYPGVKPFTESRCLNCGRRIWPQEILDQRALARAVHFANEKVKQRRSVAY